MERTLNDVILNLNKVRQKLESLQEEKSELEKEGIQILGETQILCPECKEQNALKKIDFYYNSYDSAKFWVVCPKCERNFPIPDPILKQIFENMHEIRAVRFDELFRRRLINKV